MPAPPPPPRHEVGGREGFQTPPKPKTSVSPRRSHSFVFLRPRAPSASEGLDGPRWTSAAPRPASPPFDPPTPRALHPSFTAALSPPAPAPQRGSQQRSVFKAQKCRCATSPESPCTQNESSGALSSPSKSVLPGTSFLAFRCSPRHCHVCPSHSRRCVTPLPMKAQATKLCKPLLMGKHLVFVSKQEFRL